MGKIRIARKNNRKVQKHIPWVPPYQQFTPTERSCFLKKHVSSLKPPIDLLKSIFTRLELKGQAFDLYEASTEYGIFKEEDMAASRTSICAGSVC